MKSRLIKEFILITLLCITTTSCLAVGVPYSRNPRTLLAYAYEMNLEGRPMRMKELIDRAYKINLNKNDPYVLAEINRLYGKYYRYNLEGTVLNFSSDPVKNHAQLEKSLEYYLKAFDVFKSLEAWGNVAFVSVEIGQAYLLLNDKVNTYYFMDQADKYFDKFLEKHTSKEFPYKLSQPNFSKFVDDSRMVADKFFNNENKK